MDTVAAAREGAAQAATGLRKAMDVQLEAAQDFKDEAQKLAGQGLAGLRELAGKLGIGLPGAPSDAAAPAAAGVPRDAPGRSVTSVDADRAATGILTEQNPERAANHLAALLRGQSPADRDRLMAALFRTNPELTSRVLEAATHQKPRLASGHDPDLRVAEDNRKLIAESLGHVFDSGLLTAGHLLDHLDRGGPGGEYREKSMAVASLVRESGSSSLQSAFAGQGLERAQKDPMMWGHLNGAAAQAASGSQEATAALLNKLGSAENLDKFLKAYDKQRAAGQGSLQDLDGLKSLVAAAAEIRPPTEQTIHLMLATSGRAKDNPPLQTALAGFFNEHADAVIEHVSRNRKGEAQVFAESNWIQFNANVLFSPGAGQVQNQARELLATKLQEKVQQAEAPGTSPDRAKKLAIEAGNILGGAEVGFKVAMSRPGADVGSLREGMARFLLHSLVDKASGLCPLDISIPGTGGSPVGVKGMSTELLKGQIDNWIGSSRPSAEDMTFPLFKIAKGLSEDHEFRMLGVRGAYHDFQENYPGQCQ